MEDERKNENPVNSGVSLFKILLIALLVIVVGLLFYMYNKENEVYDDDRLFDSSENENFYYKGVPDRVEDSKERHIKDTDVGRVTDMSSESKVFEYEEDESYAEKKYLDNFNSTLKNNIVLTKATPSVGDKNEVIYEITNNNAEPIGDFDMKIAFFDAAGKLIDIDDINVDFISANSTTYESSYIHGMQPFARYDYIVTKDYYYDRYIECKDAIKYEITEDKEMDDYVVKVENISNDNLEKAIFQAKYYDAAGNIIHVDEDYVYLYEYEDEEEDGGFFGKIISKGEETDYDENELRFSKHLYDDDYNEIPYAKCEITFYTAYRIEEVD